MYRIPFPPTDATQREVISRVAPWWESIDGAASSDEVRRVRDAYRALRSSAPYDPLLPARPRPGRSGPHRGRRGAASGQEGRSWHGGGPAVGRR